MPKSASRRGLVLVTGGSGYVAGYCVAHLLNDGWSVRATARSVANTAAVRASVGSIASRASEIEFVPADLLSDAGWDGAAVGAQSVLPAAPPVPATDPKDDDELVRPARDAPRDRLPQTQVALTSRRTDRRVRKLVISERPA
jgi:nucleoside-diphosphate-sugar epimerase